MHSMGAARVGGWGPRILLALIMITAMGCDDRDPGSGHSAGTDEQHPGLRNAREARSTELVFSIPPSLGDQEPVFHSIVSIRFRPEGEEVYVSDRFNLSIRVFDRDGRLLREFGREGDGPGEFRRPPPLHLSGERVQAWDPDRRRITFFSLAGEYLGDHTSAELDPDGVSPSTHDNEVMMRGDQILGRWGVRNVQGVRLVSSDGTVLQEHRYHTGSVWAVWPGRASPVVGERFGGQGGTTAVSGDSLYVFVDGYRGSVHWYEVGPGRVREVCRRDLGWPLIPAEVDQAALRRRVADERGIAPGEIDLLYPEFVGHLRSTGFPRLDTSGRVWLRLGTGDTPPWPYIVVSCDPSEPVRQITFPFGFYPSDIRGDLAVGEYRDEETEARSIRAYRVVW